MWRLMLVLTVALLCCSSVLSLSCKDENNGNVDWFILYKAPLKKGTPTGLEYVYIYPDHNEVIQFDKGDKINDANGFLANTLKPMLQQVKDKKFGFISYNDQYPKGNADKTFGFIGYNDQYSEGNADETFGHSKGVVMVNDNSQTGVWLLHSTPKFPSKTDESDFWPSNGKTKGQTFVCVTFSYKELETIGNHLQYIRAYPFQKLIPENLKAYKYFTNVDPKSKVEIPPVAQLNEIYSKNGVKFYSIAKNQAVKKKTLTEEQRRFGDLYLTISNQIDSDVDVQVFPQRNGKPEKSNWDGKVNNTECITMKKFNQKWQPSVDHSKWSVASGKNKHWTCIADVNRAWSQFKRRGGALCIENQRIAEIFREFVGKSEDCSDVEEEVMITDEDEDDDDDDNDDEPKPGPSVPKREKLK